MRRGYSCITMPLGQIERRIREEAFFPVLLDKAVFMAMLFGVFLHVMCSVLMFSCFLMVCNLTFPSTKTHQKQSERAKFPKIFWGGMPLDPPREECASHGNPPFQILPTPLETLAL